VLYKKNILKKTFMKKSLVMSIKKNLLAIVIASVVIMCAQPAVAQKRWSFELRSGVDFATEKLGDETLKTGYGFEGTLAYQFIPSLGIYGGWSWNNFASDQTFEGNKLDFNETGYCAGLQLIHPFRNSKISYMLKGGATYNHIETENSEGKIVDDSGHGLGWQAGAGLAIPLGNRIQLIPEIRYRSLSRDITLGGITTPVELNYVSRSLGLSFSF
jgi:opacity protein-like surface antigen